MPAAEPVAADRVPVMRSQRENLVDARGGAIADDATLEDRDELTFREIVDLASDVASAIVFDAGISSTD